VTILLVEDDADVREVLAGALEHRGYRVETARNGYEGLAALERGVDPFVILLDLCMDRMDGFDFRGEQRVLPHAAHIPVVVMSAHHDLLAEAEVLEADAYLAKPIHLDDLLAILQRLGERATTGGDVRAAGPRADSPTPVSS
jgi:two-component system response regulator RpaA